jgi:hypothetical protein
MQRLDSLHKQRDAQINLLRFAGGEQHQTRKHPAIDEIASETDWVLDRIERTSQEMEELADAPLPEERVTTLDDKLTAAQAKRCPMLRTRMAVFRPAIDGVDWFQTERRQD